MGGAAVHDHVEQFAALLQLETRSNVGRPGAQLVGESRRGGPQRQARAIRHDAGREARVDLLDSGALFRGGKDREPVPRFLADDRGKFAVEHQAVRRRRM